MAALDFGMALARGMLPTSEKAQKDLLNLAGGRNVFKSEDWWNQQVDKQISSGYRESQKGTVYKTTGGDWAIRSGVVTPTETGEISGSYSNTMFQPPKDALIKGYTGGGWGPGGIFSGQYYGPSPIYETREVTYYGPDTGRKDYTAGELSDIERSAEAGAKRAKKQTEQVKASQKRLRRGTGGLAAKAILPGDKPATGLPALGETGLGLGTATLGKGLML